MYGGLLEHFCVLVCMCASVHGWCTYAHVRVCTYECLRSYFIYSYIVACVCKFWIFEFTMNSFICVCVYHGALMYTIRIVHGSSANTWHICMKSANLRAVRDLSLLHCGDKSRLYNSVYPDTRCRHSNQTSLLMDLY